MRQNYFQFNLNISFLREGNKFIAYCPALDLSTCGDTYEQAKKRFGEAANIFFEEITKKGTLHKVLFNLGWQQKDSSWSPPIVVAEGYQMVNVPNKLYASFNPNSLEKV